MGWQDAPTVESSGWMSAPEIAQDKPAKPIKIGKDAFGDTLRQVLREADWGTRNIAGAGTALSDLWEGGKQLFGQGDKQAIEANNIIKDEAPVGAMTGNVALIGGTAGLAPALNTAKGAAAMSTALGLASPTDDENVVRGKAINTGLSLAAGMAGQQGGKYLANRMAGKQAELAAQQSKNSVRDATLAAGQDAGYVVPRSEVNPSFMSNRLESLGGKAAIKQEAAVRNQQVTNDLARKALGLADDQPLDVGAIESVRKAAYAPYKEVANLPKQTNSLKMTTGDPKADLEALKQARSDSKGWFDSYNRSANPEELAKAKSANALAELLENKLEGYAKAAGRDDLIPQLREARKVIAKTYTVERALNKGDGNISAPVLGRLFQKGKPLSDGLDTIGQFQTAFPKFMGEAAKTPAAGVSKSEALAGALMGAGGAAMTGSPIGLAAAGLPLLSHPARSIALSKAMQSSPEYALGMPAKLAQLLLARNQVAPFAAYGAMESLGQ